MTPLQILGCLEANAASGDPVAVDAWKSMDAFLTAIGNGTPASAAALRKLRDEALDRAMQWAALAKPPTAAQVVEAAQDFYGFLTAQRSEAA